MKRTLWILSLLGGTIVMPCWVHALPRPQDIVNQETSASLLVPSLAAGSTAGLSEVTLGYLWYQVNLGMTAYSPDSAGKWFQRTEGVARGNLS